MAVRLCSAPLRRRYRSVGPQSVRNIGPCGNPRNSTNCCEQSVERPASGRDVEEGRLRLAVAGAVGEPREPGPGTATPFQGWRVRWSASRSSVRATIVTPSVSPVSRMVSSMSEITRNGAFSDGLTTRPVPEADSPSPMGAVTAWASCHPTRRLGTGSEKFAKPWSSVTSVTLCFPMRNSTSAPTMSRAACRRRLAWATSQYGMRLSPGSSGVSVTRTRTFATPSATKPR